MQCTPFRCRAAFPALVAAFWLAPFVTTMAPTARAGDASSVVVGILQIDDLCKSQDFSIVVLMTLADSLQAQSVTVTAGDGTTVMEMEVDPGWWYGDVYAPTFDQLKQIGHGTWTITINGPSPSVSTFTLDANALQESDIFPASAILYPTPGSVVGPNVVFSWSDPTNGSADALIVWYDQEDFDDLATNLDGTLELDATSWAPQCALDPDWADFGVLYLRIDPTLVGPLTVQSGEITWAADPWAPAWYPDQTPLLLIGPETEVCFEVDDSDPAPCCLGDLNGDCVVNGADLAILLAAWGPCADCDSCPPDLNGDCTVNGADLATLLSNWG